jgi:hypothetical protein
LGVCDPSQGYYCSLATPNYGCTQDQENSCTEIHLCNAPTELLLSVALFTGKDKTKFTTLTAFSWKNFVKKKFIFFVYRGFTANLGYACENLGGLGPLVGEEIDPAQTVVNPDIEHIIFFMIYYHIISFAKKTI